MAFRGGLAMASTCPARIRDPLLHYLLRFAMAFAVYRLSFFAFVGRLCGLLLFSSMVSFVLLGSFFNGAFEGMFVLDVILVLFLYRP